MRNRNREKNSEKDYDNKYNDYFDSDKFNSDRVDPFRSDLRDESELNDLMQDISRSIERDHTIPPDDVSNLQFRLGVIEDKIMGLESAIVRALERSNPDNQTSNSTNSGQMKSLQGDYKHNSSNYYASKIEGENSIPTNPLIDEPGLEQLNRKNGNFPLLRHINTDYYTMVIVMRWIEFMFQQVTRENFIVLLDYYMEIGWISTDVKAQLLAFARGTMQDVTNYEPIEPLGSMECAEDGIISPIDEDADVQQNFKKVGDWRLSAENHLKSLLFIKKIGGNEINKDALGSLESEISNFKVNLQSYYGI